MSDAAAPPITLIACDVLRGEVEAIAARNGWKVGIRRLGAALHDRPQRLGVALDSATARQLGASVLVGYGACSPAIHALLRAGRAVALPGENCVAQLLGDAPYRAALEDGAYFLLERWARDWPRQRARGALRGELAVLRELFRAEQRYVLAIETPCSRDFRAQAERMARDVDLPLRWTRASLDPLEQALGAAIARASTEAT